MKIIFQRTSSKLTLLSHLRNEQSVTENQTQCDFPGQQASQSQAVNNERSVYVNTAHMASGQAMKLIIRRFQSI